MDWVNLGGLWVDSGQYLVDFGGLWWTQLDLGGPKEILLDFDLIWMDSWETWMDSWETWMDLD